MRHKENKLGYLFIAPATIHLLAFALVPIAYALYLSFFQWDILRADKPFVGLANYAEVLRDGPFWNAMWNSFRFTLVAVPAGIAVALAVAVLVARPLRGMAVFRTIFYIPAISSVVALSMMWIYVYLPQTGLINSFLDLLGLDASTDFLGEKPWAIWALAFMIVWTGLGPKMILFVAGLMGIPPSLYEAASLDGAGPWRSFRNVTLPMLAPTTFFVLVTGTIGSFQLFTQVYVMTKGGPLDSTDMVGYHIYTEAWEQFHIGTASAQSFILLAFIFAVAWFQFRAMRGQLEGYSAG